MSDEIERLREREAFYNILSGLETEKFEAEIKRLKGALVSISSTEYSDGVYGGRCPSNSQWQMIAIAEAALKGEGP